MLENQKASSRGSPPRTPRWLKIFVVIFILLVLLIVILHLMGFGFGGHSVSGAGGSLSGVLIEYTLFMEQAMGQL